MNRLPYIYNKGFFSLVVDLYSWAVPLNFDKIPGKDGWTYRVRILCFVFHFRTDSEWNHKYSDEDIYEAEAGDHLYPEEAVFIDDDGKVYPCRVDDNETTLGFVTRDDLN